MARHQRPNHAPAPPGTEELTDEQKEAARTALATARNAMRKR